MSDATKRVVVKISIESEMSAAQKGLKDMIELSNKLGLAVRRATDEYEILGETAASTGKGLGAFSFSGGGAIGGVRTSTGADDNDLARRTGSRGYKNSIGSSWLGSQNQASQAIGGGSKGPINIYGSPVNIYGSPVNLNGAMSGSGDGGIRSGVKDWRDTRANSHEMYLDRKERQKKNSDDEEAKNNSANEKNIGDYHAHMSNAANATMQFARGLALVSASGSGANQSLVHAIVGIEGVFNVMRGGMHAFSSLSHAVDSRQQIDATTAGAGLLGARAMMGLGILGAAALGVGIGYAGSTWVSRQFNEQEAKDYKRLHESKVERATAAYNRDAAKSLRSMNQPLALSQNMPQFFQMNRFADEAQVFRDQEANIGAAQHDAIINHRDFGWRQELRGREEQRSAFTTQRQQIWRRGKDIETQLQPLQNQEKKIAQAKAQRERQFGRIVSELEKSKIDPKQGNHPVFNWGGNAGRMTTEEIAVHNAEIDAKIEEARQTNAQHQAAENHAQGQLDNQKSNLNQKAAENKMQQLQLRRQEFSSARQNFEHDVESRQTTFRSIGALNEGQKGVVRGIQEKANRGEKLEQWERDYVRGLHGTKVADIAREQDEEAGEDSGIESNADTKKSGDQLQQATNDLAKAEKDLPDAIQKNVDAATEAAADVVKSIKEGFKIDAEIAEIGKAFEEAMEYLKNQMHQLASNILGKIGKN